MDKATESHDLKTIHDLNDCIINNVSVLGDMEDKTNIANPN